MRRIGFAVIMALGFTAACGSNVPCQVCPPLQGTWRMEYREAVDSEGCKMVAPPAPPATVTFGGSGNLVRYFINDAGFNGTVYDSNDFSINGISDQSDAGELGITLRGTYLPGRNDGGESIVGTFTQNVRKGASSCARATPFTGTR